jgi:hypothetical protein
MERQEIIKQIIEVNKKADEIVGQCTSMDELFETLGAEFKLTYFDVLALVDSHELGRGRWDDLEGKLAK